MWTGPFEFTGLDGEFLFVFRLRGNSFYFYTRSLTHFILAPNNSLLTAPTAAGRSRWPTSA